MIRHLAAALLSAAALPTLAQAGTTAITGVRVVDGRGGTIERATVVLTDDRIVAVGRSPVPRGATVIDGRGKTLLPGLVSDHSHVGQVGGTEQGARFYTRATIDAELVRYARYGVTTVVALGNNGPLFTAVRADAHADRIPGADLFGVMQGIGVPNGAPPQAMLKVAPDQLYRPATAAEAREAVARMAAAGTDLVKLWLDDFGGSVPAKMSPEVYRAVIDEAHTHGLRVAAHIHDLADAQAIVAAGADILAHGIRDRPVPAAFAAELKRRGVWYVPTLQLDEATVAWADAAPWTRTPFARAAMSSALIAQVDDPAWRAKTLAGPNIADSRSSLAMNLRNLKLLHDAGVKIGFGTDSGANPLRVPGIAEHRELALMVQAGLTPLQALTIATGRAAALMTLADRGTIAPGTRADLMLVEGDPTRDIAATQAIVTVWDHGVRVAGPLSPAGSAAAAGRPSAPRR